MMLRKKIKFKDSDIFSLYSDEEVRPVFAVPGYQVPARKAADYKANGWDELSTNVVLSREVFLENARETAPLYYLLRNEMLMFVFLGEPTRQSFSHPIGFNCFEHQQFFGKRYIYINTIRNFYKDTWKGIGKASVAQAAVFYFSIYSNYTDSNTALKIIPMDNKNRELYEYYGFKSSGPAQMEMSAGEAKKFLIDYRKRKNNYLGQD